MRCNHCGAEIKDGEIYCEHCGKAAQIVPDYNELEDDILPDILSEEPVYVKGVDSAADPAEKTGAGAVKKRRRTVAAVFAAIVVIAFAFYAGSFKSDSEAEEHPAEENEGLEEVTAYTAIPLFSESGGTYAEDMEVTLISSDGGDVYYTLDGTDPTSHNGFLYAEPIALTGGETVIRAACVNEDGKIGEISEEVYLIAYEAPEMPAVTPESGTYHEETYVTITSEEAGATIYYTWDGTNPTMDSLSYTQPILIPEGNHVLAVIVIDAHGMTSDILRCNYVYVP